MSITLLVLAWLFVAAGSVPTAKPTLPHAADCVVETGCGTGG